MDSHSNSVNRYTGFSPKSTVRAEATEAREGVQLKYNSIRQMEHRKQSKMLEYSDYSEKIASTIKDANANGGLVTRERQSKS